VDSREQRLARNENLFREINERVREIAAVHGADLHLYEFYCECSNTDCTLRVELHLRDYERVRERGDRFLIAPGHNLPDIEEIVERNDGWWVIQKEGPAGELAEELDPRGDEPGG
jgi:hypothetical protein